MNPPTHLKALRSNGSSRPPRPYVKSSGVITFNYPLSSIGRQSSSMVSYAPCRPLNLSRHTSRQDSLLDLGNQRLRHRRIPQFRMNEVESARRVGRTDAFKSGRIGEDQHVLPVPKRDFTVLPDHRPDRVDR